MFKKRMYTKTVNIARSVLDLFNRVSFKNCSCFVVIVLGVVHFQLAYLKNQIRYRGETLHDDLNP